MSAPPSPRSRRPVVEREQRRQQLVGEPALARRVHHQPDVLDHAVQGERRVVPGALGHDRALRLGVRRVRRASLDRLEEQPRLEAERLGQAHRLGGGRADRGDPGVHGQLQRARVAEPLADLQRAGADRVEGRRAPARRRRPAPETTTVSLPSSAGCLVPSTGASSSRSAHRAAASAIRRIPSGPTVVVWAHTASGPEAPTTSPVTSSTLVGVEEHREGDLGSEQRVGDGSAGGDPVAGDRLGAVRCAVPHRRRRGPRGRANGPSRPP